LPPERDRRMKKKKKRGEGKKEGCMEVGIVQIDLGEGQITINIKGKVSSPEKKRKGNKKKMKA